MYSPPEFVVDIKLLAVTNPASELLNGWSASNINWSKQL